MDGAEFLRNYGYNVVFFGDAKNIESMLKITSSKAKKGIGKRCSRGDCCEDC